MEERFTSGTIAHYTGSTTGQHIYSGRWTPGSNVRAYLDSTLNSTSPNTVNSISNQNDDLKIGEYKWRLTSRQYWRAIGL